MTIHIHTSPFPLQWFIITTKPKGWVSWNVHRLRNMYRNHPCIAITATYQQSPNVSYNPGSSSSIFSPPPAAFGDNESQTSIWKPWVGLDRYQRQTTLRIPECESAPVEGWKGRGADGKRKRSGCGSSWVRMTQKHIDDTAIQWNWFHEIGTSDVTKR